MIVSIGSLIASLLAISSSAISTGANGGGTPSTQPTSTYEYFAYVPVRRIYAHFTNSTYADDYYFFTDFSTSVTTVLPLETYTPSNPLESRIVYTSPDRNFNQSAELTWSSNTYDGRADVYVNHASSVGYVPTSLDNEISGDLYSSVLGFTCDDFFVDSSFTQEYDPVESNRFMWYVSVNDPDDDLFGATYDVGVSCSLVFYLDGGDILTTNVDIVQVENFALGGNIVDYGTLALNLARLARNTYEDNGYNLTDSTCVVRDLTISISNEVTTTNDEVYGLADYGGRITGYAFQFLPMTSEEYYATKDYSNVVIADNRTFIDNDFRPLDWLSNVVESFLTLPIFTTQSGLNVTLGGLVSTMVMVTIVIIILKMYFGG